jgi:hypothetical protein
VRHLALKGLSPLIETSREEVWTLAEAALEDPNIGVVYTASQLIEYLGQVDPERSEAGFFRALDRVVAAPKSEYLIEHVRSIIQRAFAGSVTAVARLSSELLAPWPLPAFSLSLAFELSNYLIPDGMYVERAVALLGPLVERLTAHLASMRAQHGPNVSTFPEPDRADTETSIKILTEVAQRTYYNTGTMIRVEGGLFEDSGTITSQHYALIRPLLVALAHAPLTHTTYNVVKTLIGAIATNPPDVLALGTEAMILGAPVGLANDGFAESTIREFLMRYIRQHRALLESNRDALAGLMDVVDAFAEAGWPQWIDVAFELDALYQE